MLGIGGYVYHVVADYEVKIYGKATIICSLPSYNFLLSSLNLFILKQKYWKNRVFLKKLKFPLFLQGLFLEKVYKILRRNDFLVISWWQALYIHILDSFRRLFHVCPDFLAMSWSVHLPFMKGSKKIYLVRNFTIDLF